MHPLLILVQNKDQPDVEFDLADVKYSVWT